MLLPTKPQLNGRRAQGGPLCGGTMDKTPVRHHLVLQLRLIEDTSSNRKSVILNRHILAWYVIELR